MHTMMKEMGGIGDFMAPGGIDDIMSPGNLSGFPTGFNPMQNPRSLQAKYF